MEAKGSHLFLSIRNKGKAIPYNGINHDDGNKNHGCKIIKGDLKRIAEIPEAQDNPALLNALTVLNHPASEFFTVGCEKSCNQDAKGHWMRGYLEFSFNYFEKAFDAQSYFALFFHFHRWYWQQPQIADVQYEFELEGAEFIDFSKPPDNPVGGYTVAVWITTEFKPSEEAARSDWAWALNALITYLASVRIPAGEGARIY